MKEIAGIFITAGLGLLIASPSLAQDQAADGKKLFTMQCGSCHSVEAGKNGVGPSLAGVVGRHAGSLPGFNYSQALKNSGIVWDEKSLDGWVTNPVKDVPGARMYFAGVSDATKRQAIIAYLKSL